MSSKLLYQSRTRTQINMSRYTIVDEADEMVSPGEVDDMREIMGGGILTIHTQITDNDFFQSPTMTMFTFI